MEHAIADNRGPPVTAATVEGAAVHMGSKIVSLQKIDVRIRVELDPKRDMLSSKVIRKKRMAEDEIVKVDSSSDTERLLMLNRREKEGNFLARTLRVHRSSTQPGELPIGRMSLMMRRVNMMGLLGAHGALRKRGRRRHYRGLREYSLLNSKRQ